jgi:Domain of unknown function (DUF3291)
MKARLAIYNFGIFRMRADDPVNDGFREREGANFAAAERAPGFVARSGYAGEEGPPSWGEQVFPRFYVERGDKGSPSTLSLWQDLESLFAFAYHGVHAEALKRAPDWFVEKQWPPYVLWWIEGDRRPDWREAVARFERLHDRGPEPQAFNFKTAFDAHGAPLAVDRARARRLAVSSVPCEDGAPGD